MTDRMPDRGALRADARVAFAEDVLRFGDTDLNGHINNAAFAVLCESGRVTYFRERIPPMAGRFFVVAHLEIDFRSELTYPGRVETATWLRRVGGSSLGLAQVLFADDGRIAATSSAVCVAMGSASRRPLPFADEVRECLSGMVRPDGS